MREALWLVHNGVPFNIAMGLSEKEEKEIYLSHEESFAYSIIFSEFNGGKFNFDKWRFEDDLKK